MGKLLYLFIFLFFGMIGSCEDQDNKKNLKENHTTLQMKKENKQRAT